MANSIFSYDNVLPGVLTEVESTYEAGYDTSQFGTTDSCVIVGTAFDGPVGFPTPIYSLEHAKYLYGKSFDPTTHREGSLYIGIQAAWNNGCRTIYGCRINGKDLQKTFNLREESAFKLRLQSRYPSNVAKDCFLIYDDTRGAEKITLVKVPEKATIAEKMNGLVESVDKNMKVEIKLAQDYNLSKNDKLTNVISIVNNHAYNNVLELALVDASGVAVTYSDEAHEIALGAMHPGIYFLGRGDSACEKITKVKTSLVIDEDDEKPYKDFDGNYFRTIEINTDSAQPLPVWFNSANKTKFFEVCGIGELTDLINEVGASKLIFPADKVDYEETKLSNWEIYNKLGKGFAQTAHLQRRFNKEGKELTPKVVETDFEDPKYVVGIENGIYSILEDASINYRVLGNDICADAVISGKLPKPADFKTTSSLYGTLLSDNIEFQSRVESNNETDPKTYEIHIYAHDEIPKIDKNKILLDKVFKTVGHTSNEKSLGEITGEKGEIAIVFANDEASAAATAIYQANEKGKFEKSEANDKFVGYYMAGKHLVEVSVEENNFVFKTITAMSDLEVEEDKEYYVAETNGDLFLMEFGDLTDGKKLVSTINTAVDEDRDTKLGVFYQSSTVGTNYVYINFPYFDTLTLVDFVELLNESVLNKAFKFKIASEKEAQRHEYVVDIDSQNSLTAGNSVVMKADRKRGYDYSKYIPFTTSDNFTRQAAQSATYQELKTSPCHIIIGCQRISDTTKTALANKIAELKNFNWNLYVKNNFGRNMLTANNMPYPIGRSVSVVCMQDLETADNYDTVMNGAAAYAGLISSLDIGTSSTAQAIDINPMFEFSSSQLQTLSAMGIVTCRNTYTKGYVITDGVTMANPDDTLRRLFNTRICNFVETQIRAACEPFIGQANSAANRNSLQTAINAKLSALKDILLRAYKFEIMDDGSADQYVYIDIDYTIVIYNEIREIRNYLHIKN